MWHHPGGGHAHLGNWKTTIFTKDGLEPFMTDSSSFKTAFKQKVIGLSFESYIYRSTILEMATWKISEFRCQNLDDLCSKMNLF